MRIAKVEEKSSVLCDKRMPIRLKARCYKAVVRPAILCGSVLDSAQNNGIEKEFKNKCIEWVDRNEYNMKYRNRINCKENRLRYYKM